MAGALEHARPWSVRGVMTLATAGAALGVRAPLEPEALIRAARARERRRGPDPGDRSFGPTQGWREGLTRLCEALEREAELHALGRWIVREQLVTHLCTRLRVQALLAARPELLSQPLAPPIVITGMQRTGTTKLQRLLAADPGTRALLSWEGLEPLPSPRSAPPERAGPPDYRIAKAHRAVKALRWMAPIFFSIHPVEHLAPEEDVLLLDPSFRSTTPEAIWSVPSFSRWLEGQDMREAYTELRTLLLILQDQRPGQAWVLKTPHHLEHLETLFEVIPEAKLVWTHRDPLTTVASFCSMVFHGRRVYSDAVDPRVVGQQWSTKVARMVQRGLDTRDAGHEDAILDLHYEPLLADPLAAVERIYTFAGRTLSPAARHTMQTALAVQTQHRYGVHRYALDDFGLDAAGVAEQFRPYRERFGFEAAP